MLNQKKTYVIQALVFVSLISATMFGQYKPAGTGFNEFNKPIQFEKLTSVTAKQATENAIATAKTMLKNIYSVKKEERTFNNTMLAYDDLSDVISSNSSFMNLMTNVHPDNAVREQCQISLIALNQFGNDLALDEDLYSAIKEYAGTEDAQTLTGYKKKFFDITLRGFERSGFALSKDKRDELKKMQNRLSELNVQFETNIAEHKDSLIVDEQGIAGLPESYKIAHKTGENRYSIDLSYPSYVPFMRYSDSEKDRKALYIKFASRAADKNRTTLKEMIQLRHQIANLLGYKTYAAYNVEMRMAKTAGNVWKFEKDLMKNLKSKVDKDYQELLNAKRDFTNDSKADRINPWESGYYNTKLLKSKYKLDNQKVKEYFAVNDVITGMFTIYEHLFSVKFSEVQSPSVWHEDVRMFEVQRDQKTIARFYLDLYPRENKFGHAACFPVISGKMTNDGYQWPVTSLVCNFPKPAADNPGLMPHDDVGTFFHEFGHLLHSLLTRSELSSQSGMSVVWDFVEMPSTLFENWTWNYESLKLFAKHYQTREVLPKDLFDRMIAAKNVGSGIANLQQVFYGIYDMTLHDKYDPNGKESTTDIYKNLQNEILPYQFVDGTAPDAGFGHLVSYAAGYYSYLWGEVYAQDAFSVFEKNGIMDKPTGEKLLKGILEKGGSVDEYKMVKEFLGRDPNQQAFLKSIGL